ncbi:type I polyketide synthase, partial [Streptomyces sp. NPDC023998]|uniref:type I polyketide synthase n=1 Tax=Streptomyces sp. NPDC023998 TaxID=3154597 RepID=UPI0033D362F4
RSALEHRAVVLGKDRDELAAGLEALAAGEPSAQVVQGAAQHRDGAVFVFPGHGSQWVGMAESLLASSPVFRAAFEECATALAPFVDFSPREALTDAALLERVEVVQPVLWAVMVSLAALWRAHGVEPAAVVGHSQGEVAAACVVGALTLEEGARVVAARSRALASLPSGGMVSVAQSAERTAARLERWNGRLDIAVVNAPSSVVVSGAADACDELLAECESEGVRARRLPAAQAGHSAHVEAVRATLTDALRDLGPKPSTIPFYSSVEGGAVDTAGLDAGYWYRNLRHTVRFDRAARALADDGHRAFCEISPHPVLTFAVAETLEGDSSALVLGTLRRGEGGLERFFTALGSAYARGLPVDWTPLLRGAAGPAVELPTYAFQRRRYWADPAQHEAPVSGDAADAEFWAAVQSADGADLARLTGIEPGGALDGLRSALATWRRRRAARSEAGSWHHRVRWQPVGELAAGALSGVWLLVVAAQEGNEGVRDGRDGGADATAAVLVRALEARGARVVRIAVDASSGPGTRRERLAALLRQAAQRAEAAATGVLSLLPLEERAADADDAFGHPGTAATLALLQALADVGVQAPLWSVTSGAVSVADSDPLTRPQQAPVWGLGRAAALETPKIWGGLVDLPAVIDERTASRLVRLLAGAGPEDRFAVRASGVYVPRLVPLAAGAPGQEPAWSPPEGTVLVTDGTSGPGAEVARRLAALGAGHLLLTQAAAPPHAQLGALKRELGELGALVTVADCDPGDADAVAALLRTVPEGRKLSAVVHTAEIRAEIPLDRLEPGQLELLLDRKARAAWNLHRLTLEHRPAAFVLFSSLAATLGTGAGLGGHAAASAYLDALAAHRRGAGLPATSVAWGPWEEPDAEPVRRERLTGRGIPPMDPRSAADALLDVLGRDEPTAVVAALDWERYLRAFDATRPDPLIGSVPDVVRLRAAAATGTTAAAVSPERLAALEHSERLPALRDLVRSEVAVVLGHADAAAVEPHRGFLELGLDSLTTVELRNRLAAATGLPLKARAILDHRTPEALAGHLYEQFAGSEPENPEASGTSATSGARATRDTPPPSHPSPALSSASSLRDQLLDAVQRGVTGEFTGRLVELGRSRPSFTTPGPGDIPEPVPLASGGSGRPVLFCLPTVMATMGAHQYARFAAPFRGERGVQAVPLPGFTADERLPASLDALVDALAEAVRRRAGEEAYGLVGYSSGGLLAHLVARRLESDETKVSAVVLLDTSAPLPGEPVQVAPGVLAGMAARASELTPLDDARLTAMGSYLGLLEEWRYVPVEAPTLLVRAGVPVPGQPGGQAWRAVWERTHDAVEVPADHFTMIEQSAEHTARAVRDWLDASNPHHPT